MDTRTQFILVIIWFVITTGIILWFLSDAPSQKKAPSAEIPSGPCNGSVYRMVYQYNSEGECVPFKCESGYQKIGDQCVFSGSDTSNRITPTVARAGLRLGKIRR